jgi:hypothetical protein
LPRASARQAPSDDAAGWAARATWLRATRAWLSPSLGGPGAARLSRTTALLRLPAARLTGRAGCAA